MVRRFLILMLAFVAMVVGLEGIQRLVDLAQGKAPASALDFLWMLAVAPIVWLWWRFLSPFGKGRGRCLNDDSCSRR
ncbi:MAG: hypothetical protein N2441_00865 [Rhodocyclaceae bacterium]|nr:hypothetical protein [Rhodocyclaceae bacterium]